MSAPLCRSSAQRDYSGFGPFCFALAQYKSELAGLLNAIGRTVSTELLPRRFPLL
jgi:hypothetical protein